MLSKTRSELPFALALLLGSFIGGMLMTTANADGASDLLSNFDFLHLTVITVTGFLFGLIPYLILGIPSCLILEAEISSPMIRSVILMAIGTAAGAAIPAAILGLGIFWGGAVGGATGLTLGILRRRTATA